MAQARDYLTNYKAVVDTDPARVLTIDWETYWDSKEFSLKKLSMEEYVRDPRFKAHGIGVKLGGGPSLWIYGESSVRSFFAKAPIDTMTVVGHNMHFDGLVL